MSSFVNCDVNDFYENIMAMFENTVDEAEEQLQDDVYHAADMAKEELFKAKGIWSQMVDTPEREKLLYEKGWKAYKYKPREGHVEAVVANSTAPGLTHLIEKGHELFIYGRDTGHRTKARPHIKEAYEKAAKKYFGGV